VPNTNTADLRIAFKRIMRYEEVMDEVKEAKLLELKAIRLYELSLE